MKMYGFWIFFAVLKTTLQQALAYCCNNAVPLLNQAKTNISIYTEFFKFWVSSANQPACHKTH